MATCQLCNAFKHECAADTAAASVLLSGQHGPKSEESFQHFVESMTPRIMRVLKEHGVKPSTSKCT